MPLLKRPSQGRSDSPGGRWKAALEATLKVSEIAASATALPDAVHAMVRIATDLLDVEQGSIMLLDDSGQMLEVVASYGLPPDVPAGVKVRLGESVAGRVLATGQPLRLGKVDRDAFVNFIPKTREIVASLVVPLRVQGRPSGVLNLATSIKDHRFSDEDVRVAQMFADQAAGLIHRVALHEQAEHRSWDLMTLVESSKGLLGTLDIDTLLQHVLDGGSRFAGTSDGFACLFDRESGELSRGVFRGIDKSRIRELIDHPEAARAVEHNELRVLDVEPYGTMLAVGLRTTRNTKGLLMVASDSYVIESRRQLIRAFAQQCSTALGTGELHELVERTESEMTSVIHGVPNPIILVDAQKRFVAINPAAEQLFGISAVFSAGSPAAGALGSEEVETYLLGEGNLQGELMVGSPPRTYKIRVIDVRVPGTPIGRVLLMDDITTEREIVQTQRDFVAMIGHELRTPLTIIKGFARMMLKRLDRASVDEANEALTTIDAKAVQLERLIEDLLYVSHVEAREASLSIEPVDVAAVIRTVANEVIRDYPDREIVLDDVPLHLEWPCDEAKITLVVRHLIDNGLKYSEAPSTVTVRAADDGDTLRVDVVDEGIGLVSSDLPDIFERFRQVDASSTREHGGTGVGLYLCAQLVRVHQGRIWADSTWGKGSTFSFELPRRTLRKEIVAIDSARTNRLASG